MAHSVRPASLIDIVSIARTRRRQRVLRLNPPYTLVQPDPLFTDMLRSQMPLQSQTTMLYVYQERGVVQGYLQVRSRWRRNNEWAITLMGTTERAAERVWEALLEEVCTAAGEAEVVRLFVKVDKNENVTTLFRKFGFTAYTNEHVWGNLYFAQAEGQLDEPDKGPLRRLHNHDSWDLLQLYRAITPPATQRAEALTTRQWRVSPLPRPGMLAQGLLENAFVWPDMSQGEKGSTQLGGFVRLLTGARGHWITLMYRPEQENRSVCDQALQYVLWKASRLGKKPVYCAVREYQAEIESMLAEKIFHLLTEQSLLVKYIAEPVRDAQPALVPFLVPKKGEFVATDFSAWPPNSQQ
jgi:hypothetical protein